MSQIEKARKTINQRRCGIDKRIWATSQIQATKLVKRSLVDDRGGSGYPKFVNKVNDVEDKAATRAAIWPQHTDD